MRMRNLDRVIMLIIKLLALLPITAAAVSSALGHHSRDTMLPTKTITDGSQTIISSGGRFEMGFFSPAKSNNRYLGIWYHNMSVQTVVWVANRATPLSSSDSGTLHLSPDGNLVLSGKHGRAFWSTNSSSNGRNPVLRLLDSGNLILFSTAKRSDRLVWQSFDHPSETALPGTKIGVDYRHNISWEYTSWRSSSDPSPGDYCLKFSNYDVPEIYVWRGSHKMGRWYGPWDWPKFVEKSDFVKFELYRDAYCTYVSGDLLITDYLLRIMITATGSLKFLLWNSSSSKWTEKNSFPWDTCDKYAICGANGFCDPSFNPICKCLKGYVPKSPNNWNKSDYSDGCVREAALNCSTSDTFTLLHNMKVPDTENATSDRHMNLSDCRNWCLRNCSCTAYAVLGATGCVVWRNDVYDVRVSSSWGNDLYVRIFSSVIDSTEDDSGNQKRLLAIILVSAFSFLLVFSGVLLCFKKRRGQKQATASYPIKIEDEDDVELPLYSMITIQDATDGFSTTNVIGEGGFGTVFKGKLGDGQEIAVKRLSKESTQGPDEFKTEVNLIAKLQHRNLIRLLGYCINDKERMLIYEYMHNGNLDAFIFDGRNNALLTWQKCIDIIIGIARGLLYLHKDSRLKVIHRDLKPSNILLDKDLNPKISDFGVARILKAGQLDEQTRRVVGTYGYMAPEYALDGLFSDKSDVFSFGIIVLKILFAKSNEIFLQKEDINFMEQLWKLWKKDRGLELAEGAIGLSDTHVPKILKCIQIGLLCVEENSEDRPTMDDVLLMLSDDSNTVPLPKQPAFCSDSSAPTTSNILALNEVTITQLQGR